MQIRRRTPTRLAVIGRICDSIASGERGNDATTPSPRLMVRMGSSLPPHPPRKMRKHQIDQEIDHGRDLDEDIIARAAGRTVRRLWFFKLQNH